MKLQTNLGYRTILFSAKSVFDQKIQDFYVSDFEYTCKFGSGPNREKPSKHECATMLHPSAFETKVRSGQTWSLSSNGFFTVLRSVLRRACVYRYASGGDATTSFFCLFHFDVELRMALQRDNFFHAIFDVTELLHFFTASLFISAIF